MWEPEVGPGASKPQYNRRLLFIDQSLAAVSHGCGRLSILATGDRRLGRPWGEQFSEEVCGRGRAFMLAAVCRQGTGLEVVLQYVEHRDSVEGVGLPSSPHTETHFLTCLERLWLVQTGTGG